jgi:hypothetical protein
MKPQDIINEALLGMKALNLEYDPEDLRWMREEGIEVHSLKGKITSANLFYYGDGELEINYQIDHKASISKRIDFDLEVAYFET